LKAPPQNIVSPTLQEIAPPCGAKSFLMLAYSARRNVRRHKGSAAHHRLIG
jgi:hypothetical protein